MTTIDDFGGPGTPLGAPQLGGTGGWAEAIRNAIASLQAAVRVTNPQTGTTYTLVLSDAGKIVELGNAAAVTLTVPHSDTVTFPIGTQIELLQTGAGQVTVAGAASVTVNAKTGLKIAEQWGAATLIKRSANVWVLIGALSA